MVATIGRMASDSYYLEAQKTWRPAGEEGAAGGLFPGGGTDGGTPGGGTSAASGEAGATGYYVETGEEPDGIWWNPGGLFGVADGGAVDARDFRRLYHGFDPASGEALVRNAGSEKRSPGLDITFSADKSVSALWAIAGGDLRDEIAQAHNDACRVALEEIIRRHCNWTRIRPKGGDIELVRGELAGAMFQHGTSRENDPQLHTHCLVFNLVQDEEGEVRSHYRLPVFRWKKAAGATYRNALAWNLQQRLGIAMERYGKEGEFTRVAGMPESLIAEWSKRRRAIEGMAAGMGFDTGANAAAAAALNKATRAAKVAGQGEDLRHVAWDLEAAAHIEDREEFIASLTGQEVAATIEEIAEANARLDRIPADITAHEAVFRLPDIVEKAMNATAGVLGPATSRASVERVLGNEEVVELDMPPASIEVDYGLAHTRVFSTRSEIDMEAEVGRMAKEAALDPSMAIAAEDIEMKLAQLAWEERTLSDEQTEAIRHGAGVGSGRLAIIEGAAGAGKTTTLKPIVDLYRERGATVIATAVAWRTAVALGNDCRVNPYSVDRLLRRVAKGTIELDDTTVIVVDEAGMLSTRQTYHLMRLAEEHGCKVICAGDTEQHQPIGAGPGLRLMRQAAGGVRVDEIRRQKPDAEDVLTQVDGIEAETARLKAKMMSAAERRATVARYEASEDRPDVRSWQIGVSEAIRDGRADEAIEALSTRDRLHVEKDLEATLTRLVDDWEAWRADNPEAVSTVIARTHDEVNALSHIMRERVLAGAGKDGRRVVVKVCGARSDDDRVRPLEIAEGDLLRIGTLMWEKRLFNGTIVEVSGIEVTDEGTDAERVRIDGRSEYGDDVSFFVDEATDIFGRVRLDHGYAMTVASSQGRTVDAAFVLADDRAARPTIYPALTRHREHLEVYCNREPLALAVAARKPEDEQAEPVSDAEIAEHLAGAWSRDGYKVAASDFMSPAMADRVEATYPGGKGAPAWLAANDNRIGTLKGVGRAIRNTADRWRHGAVVAGLGDEMRELDDEYDALRETWVAQGGGGPELVGAFREAASRQRDLAGRMAPFVKRPGRYEALWRSSGGVAERDVVGFRDNVEALDDWLRVAARNAQRASAGGAVDDAPEPRAEGGEMAFPSGDVRVPAHVEAAVLVEACEAQARDPFRWIYEAREHLGQLHARAKEAVETSDGSIAPSVRQFVDDWPRALGAWAAASQVVAGVDEIRENPASDRREGVLMALQAIEGDSGQIWHDETKRIVQRELARRGRLVAVEGWLAAARAELGPQEAVAPRPATEVTVQPSAPERTEARAQPSAPERTEVRAQPSPPERTAAEISPVASAPAPPPARTTGEATQARPAPARPVAAPAVTRGDPERIPAKVRLPSFGEVAAALADRADDVCRTYLPAGRRAGGYWTIGNVDGEAGDSMWVNLSGPRRGSWRDGNTGEYGDLLDVIQRSRGLANVVEAAAEARAFLGGSWTPAPEPRRQAEEAARAAEGDELGQRNRRSARSNWEKGYNLHAGDDNPATRYLARRGIDAGSASGLRWHRDVRTRVDGEWRGLPALMAKIETHDGRFEAIQRIFLQEDGRKAVLDGGAKKGLGPQGEGGVWFGNRKASRIAMTEGVEDAVAAVEALPDGALDDLAIVATAGTGRVQRVTLPPGAEELVLLQDADEGGETAWRLLNERYADGDVTVSRIVMAKDVNDDLMADRAGLERRLAPLAPARVEAQASSPPAEAAGGTADDVRDLMGRVIGWRAVAVNGGWDAADINGMGEDLVRIQGALENWPAGREGAELHRILTEFSEEAGQAVEAMRFAHGVTGAVLDLWRDRREMTAGAEPAVLASWTARAEQVAVAMGALLMAEGTAWEKAVMAELGRRVMEVPAAVRQTDVMDSPTGRARYFLRYNARELGETLQKDRRSRQGLDDRGMGRGGGMSFG